MLRHRRTRPCALRAARRRLVQLHAQRTVTVGPHEEHRSTVVFLHGLGDTALGWCGAAEFWSQTMPHTKFILPTAPTIPVSINMNMEMPAWYDLVGLGTRADEPCDGLDGTSDAVVSLLHAESEASGVPLSRTVLGGFSQGGATALYAGLTGGAHGIAGLLAMSAYLPRPRVVGARLSEPAAAPPVLMLHGDVDAMVRLGWAEESAQTMRGHGVDCALRVFGGLGHSASEEELEVALEWLLRRLPPDRVPPRR